MENKVCQLNEIKVGSRIKLKDYDLFEDYVRHKHQSAIVTRYYSAEQTSMRYRVIWSDNEESLVKMNNIILLLEDWDE